MSQIKPLLDEYGIIHEAMKILPDELKIDFLEALAELEDNECHRTRSFPKLRNPVSSRNRVSGSKHLQLYSRVSN